MSPVFTSLLCELIRCFSTPGLRADFPDRNMIVGERVHGRDLQTRVSEQGYDEMRSQLVRDKELAESCSEKYQKKKRVIYEKSQPKEPIKKKEQVWSFVTLQGREPEEIDVNCEISLSKVSPLFSSLKQGEDEVRRPRSGEGFV